MSTRADLGAPASEASAPADAVSAPAVPRRGRLFVKYVVSLVGLVAVLLIGNGALDLWFSYNETKQTLVRIQQEKAEAAAQRIAGFVDEIERQIGWTTHAQWSAGSVDQRRFDYVRLLRQVPAITELTQLDSDGHEQLKVSRLAMDVVGGGTDYSQDSKFTAAVAHKVWFSPVYFRKESEPYMTIAIAHAGRKPGVTIADVNLKLIWDVVSAIKVGQAGYAYVVGPDGRLIAHPDISLVLRDTDLSALPQVAAALSNPAAAGDPAANVSIAPNYAGVSVLSAHAAIPALNWLVFVELPASEALAPLYQLLTRSGILLGVGLLLAAAAGGWLARRMVVPIRQLQVGAERLGAGELDHRIELRTGDEIEALADRFNRMGAQLQESYATLEAKVEARTHELSESLERQTGTAEVLKVISQSPGELKPVFDTMLENATRICRAEFGRLVLYDGESFTTAAVRGATPEYRRFLEEYRKPLGPATALGQMARELKPVHLHDLTTLPSYLARDPFSVAAVELGGVRSLIAVPLLKGQTLIGGLVLFRRRVEAFTDKEIALVTTFADQTVIAIENARLLTEQREALEQQTATAEVLQVINASPGDLAPVFEAMLEKATRLCEAAFGILLTYDGERFHHAAMQSVPAPYAEFYRQNPPNYAPGTGPAQILAGERVVHIVDAMDTDSYRSGDPNRRAVVDLAGARSLLLVPLLKGDDVRGIIAIYRQEVRPFSDKQIALLQNFAAQAVIAMENARLISETREALEQQTATAEVLQVINRSPGDLAPVFDAILEKAHSRCGAAKGSLVTFDGEHFRVVATRGLSEEYAALLRASQHNLPGSPPQRLLDGESLVQIPDMGTLPFPIPAAAAEREGARTAIYVPLRKGAALLGYITAYRQEIRPFSDKQIALLQNFAAQAVIAMENARLINETREALEQQTATAEVLRVINASPGDLAPVFDTILQKAHGLCAVAYGSLHLYDGERFHAVAVHGIPEALADRLRQGFIPGPNHPSQPLLEGARFAHVPDIAEIDDPITRAAVELGGIRTTLFIPLRKDNTLLGQIVAARREVKAFTEKEIALLESFAAQAVIAIENARLLGELRTRNRDLAEALEYQTATSEVLRIVASSPDDLQPVFDAMLEKAMALCEALCGFLALYDGEAYTMAASRNVPQALKDALGTGPHRPGPHAALRRLAQTKAPVHIEDVRSDIAYLERDPWRVAAVEEGGARAQLVVPLLKKGELIGAFIIYRQEPRRFADNQIALVTNFADQAVIAIENSRLLGELRQRTGDLARSVEELTATADVLRAISSSTGELEPVLNTVVATAARLCNAERSFIVGRDGDTYRAVASHGWSPEIYAAIAATPITVDRSSLTGRTVLERRPVQILDVRADADYRFGGGIERGSRTLLGVPLMREGEPLGVICLQRTRVEAFTERQIELVRTFADQAVIAIENARLLGELRTRNADLAESLEQQTVTGEVLKVISRSTFDLTPVFETLAENAVRLCAADRAIIFRFDGKVLRPAAFYNTSVGLREFVERNPIAPGRQTVSARAALERRTVQVPDVQADPEYSYSLVDVDLIRTVLAVPMLRGDDLVGVITIWKLEVKPFTDKQVALVTIFADQAVIAIENARLLGELRHRTDDLARSVEELTATAEVLRVISSSTGDLGPVLDSIAETAARLCAAESGWIFSRDGDVYRLGGAYGFSAEHSAGVAANPITPDRGSISGRAILERRPIQVLDVRTDPEHKRPRAIERGARTILGVPLLREGEPIGVIAVQRTHVEAFTDKQIALVATFADQAVIAIENARLLGELRARTTDLQESLEHQTATSDVLKVISRSGAELEPVLDTLLDTAARICRAESGFIFRLRDGLYHMAAAFGTSAEYNDFQARNPIRPDRGSLAGRTALERRPVHIEDAAADPEYTRIQAVQLGGQRTMLGVPLFREDELIGVITLARSRVEPYSSKQIELVRTFADQAVIAMENTRLFGELRDRSAELARSVEELTATSDVLKIISRSTVDLQRVLDTLVETARRLCHADIAQMFRREGERYLLAASSGLSPELKVYVLRNPLEIGRGTTTGRAALEARPVRIADVLADPEYSYTGGQRFGGYRSTVAVPLIRGDTLLGVFNLTRNTVNPFTDKEVELLTTFADQAVIAMENARLFGELRDRSAELARSVEELTATSDVLKIISRSTVELKTVLDTLVETAASLCHADQALMFRLQGDHYQRVASRGTSREFDEYLLRNPFAAGRGTATGRAVAEGRTVHIPDVLADPESTFREGQRLSGIRTLLAVPLVRGDALIGVFSLNRTRVAPFTDKEIELVTTFADQAVIAIENARLFDELRDRSAELARSVEELTTLREVGQAVSSTLDLATVLETIVRRAVALAGAEAGAIYRYRKSDRQFRLGTSYGLGEDLTAKIREVRIREEETTALRRAIAERGPVQLPDLEAAPHLPLRDLSVAAGFRATLIVPMIGADRVFGVLSIQKKTVGEFPESTVKLMQTFASQSVLAIQNARLFREVEEQGRALALASQHKSQFLANMSHELRTPLNAVLGYAELLADGIYGELGEKARGVLERIQSNGKHLLGLINDVLDLSKIEAGQLTLAIDDYAMPAVVHSVVSATDSLAKAKGLSLVTSVPRVLPMGRGDERRLTQVLLNLVGNAIKFTEKGSVGIEVALANNCFELAVKDTGPGIAEADQARIFEEFQQVDSSSTRQKGGTGLGLAISKRIIEMHGGAITVESEPGKGSTFLVVVPVRVEAAKEVA